VLEDLGAAFKQMAEGVTVPAEILRKALKEQTAENSL
jgi:hypothetical protein